MSRNVDLILKEYDARKSLNESFSDTLKNLVERLLFAEGIHIHSISARVKERASLKDKLRNKSTPYETLDQITDIVGIRIITYYSDDVDKVAEIIQREFIIDHDNSVDKRKNLDPDKFGYMSLHYIVELNNHRTQLLENSALKGLKSEIQIRSILQHTWAEIEHDIGYKATMKIPETVRRQFSTLAALLENVDDGFIKIKSSVAEYASATAMSLENEEEVSIDAISLSDFIHSNSCFREIETEIAGDLNWTIEAIDKNMITHYLDFLDFVSINTINELKQGIESNTDIIKRYAKFYINSKNRDPFTPKGFSIYYYAHTVAFKGKSEVDIIAFGDRFALQGGGKAYLQMLTKFEV